MKPSDIELIETKYLRLRCLEFLAARDYRVLVEGLVQQDGWRAEFLGRSNSDEFAFMAHKPYDGPYIVLSVGVDLETFRRPDDFEELIDLVSEHDLTIYFPKRDRPLVHLSTRLSIQSFTADEVDYSIGNMLACRDRLCERFGENEIEEP